MRYEKNKSLASKARSLRKEMTPQERKLWHTFLKERPEHFRRQQIIGGYIADFYCEKYKLVIELDGSQHYENSGQEYDKKRDEYLRSRDLTVLRYSNADINFLFQSVREDIINYLKQISRPFALHPERCAAPTCSLLKGAPRR